MAGPVNQTVLERLTRLAGRELDAPVVCFSLVNENRRLVAGSYGLSTPIALLVSWAFMKQVVATRLPLVVTDGRRHQVAARNPAVRDGTVTAYMGIPLIAANGRAAGTLSVMDPKPRRWSVSQLDFLQRLSVRVVKEVGLGNGARSPLQGVR